MSSFPRIFAPTKGCIPAIGKKFDLYVYMFFLTNTSQIYFLTVLVEPKTISNIQKVSTEVVYLQDRKGKVKKGREISITASLRNIKKAKLISDDGNREIQLWKKEDKSDIKTNSSRSSPLSITDSIITLPDSLENSCTDIPEKDPLADTDGDDKTEPKRLNVGSLSFDYNDSSTPPPMPVFPFKRTLRKRGREVSPEPAKVVVNESKKMKMKGKRTINSNLRKSVEEKKEQQISSSDEVQIVSETKPVKRTPKKKKQKGKSKKKVHTPPKLSHKSETVEIIDDDDEEGEEESSKTKSKDKKVITEVVELSDEESSVVPTVPKPRSRGKNSK